MYAAPEYAGSDLGSTGFEVPVPTSVGLLFGEEEFSGACVFDCSVCEVSLSLEVFSDSLLFVEETVDELLS